MKRKILLRVFGILGVACLAVQAFSSEMPTIPPTISRVWPVGIKRGSTATFTVEGRNLTGTREVLFDAKGITAKVVGITDIPEPKREVKINVDLTAPVPQGKKQEAKVEITAAPDVDPGLHWLRFQTPLGTSNTAVLDVGALPEVQAQKGNSEAMSGKQIDLPATIVGTIEQPGDMANYRFSGKSGEELVFQVVAEPLGSGLRSALMLQDAAGKELARAGYRSREADAVLTYKLPSDGEYSISITDRERGGGMDHYYRLNAGPLPYLTGLFPLGVRAGQPATVAIEGVNLGSARELKVQPPASVNGWSTIPVQLKTAQGKSVNKLELAVGDEPETAEAEPNDTPGKAQRVTLPITINGHIYTKSHADAANRQAADEDYFRFTATKGQHLEVEVAAARLGSPLDSLIEILDDQGHPIPRATVRCVYQTSLTLSDRDSRSNAYRLVSTSGFHENDYLMIGDELDQIAFIPDQPDADIDVKGYGGLRMAFLGTSAVAHTVNEPVYRAQVLPPDAQFPANGLPVFHLTYRNDDGGPGYGSDSHLEFTVPRDGDYIVHLKDVTGQQGPDYAYRLTIRHTTPDFTLQAKPDNPNIPRGGRVPITVTANRGLGYNGPVEIEVRGLPKWITVPPARIPVGQDSATVILQASADAPVNSAPAPFQIVGRANVGGRKLVRTANQDMPLQVVSVMPRPDVVVSADPQEVSLEPGKTAKVTLRVNRQNGFAGRVPCFVVNLPPGVRVVNIGLNGVLVPEGQTSQSFTLKAEDWAQSLEQPIYVVGQVESNSPTEHASAPVVVKVRGRQMASTSTDTR